MTIRECYEKIGADYDAVVDRLMNEKLVQKFAVKFLQDKSFENLKTALQEQNAEEAFRAAHTLKGVCMNLGFDNLYKVSSDLTEKLRGRELDGSAEVFEKVQQQYEKTVDAIKQVES